METSAAARPELAIPCRCNPTSLSRANTSDQTAERCFQETPRGTRSPKNLQELRSFQEKVVSQWHATLDRDTVVAAHGGTGRALIAHLALAPAQDATHHAVDQGVVYVFAGNLLTRYA